MEVPVLVTSGLRRDSTWEGKRSRQTCVSVPSASTISSCSSYERPVPQTRSSLVLHDRFEDKGLGAPKCETCFQLKYKQYELKKEHKLISRKLMAHRKVTHHVELKDVRGDIDMTQNGTIKEAAPPEAENEADYRLQAPEVTALKPLIEKKEEESVSENIAYHFPFLRGSRSASQPPQPRAKRLKGSLAKSVGERIDGSNWHWMLTDDCSNGQ